MIARISGGWLPLSEDQLAALGWAEGQAVLLEVVEGVLIASPTTAPKVMPAPPSKKKMPFAARSLNG